MMRWEWAVGLMVGLAAEAWGQDVLDGSLGRASGPSGAQDGPGALPLRMDLSEAPRAQLQGGSQDKKPETTIPVEATQLQDDRLVGPYDQPAATLHRMAPNTRIYLQVPPGGVEFEQWAEIRIPRNIAGNGPNTEVRFSEEFEFGLGHRFQLDMYALTTYQATGSASTLVFRGWSTELRYALADWGKIWGNPTIYLEYIVWNHAPGSDADPASSNVEAKILLGDEIATGWYWGFNISHERTLGGLHLSVHENKLDLTLMHTLIDGFLSGGVAIEGVYEEDRDPVAGYSRTRELYMGPSFQIRLAPREETLEVVENGVRTTRKFIRNRAHLDFQPLVGIGPESFQAKVFVVFGWDF